MKTIKLINNSFTLFDMSKPGEINSEWRAIYIYKIESLTNETI
jgi:hypothetical protein